MPYLKQFAGFYFKVDFDFKFTFGDPSGTFATWQGLAQKTAPTLANSVFGFASVKGYPKRFIKTIKPSLQIFSDFLPLTCI
nr:hypothetical protein [Neisseria flavescens]